MNLEPVYANKDANINADLPNGYIQVVWVAHPTSGSFRNILFNTYHFANEHKITRWLCDMREVSYLEIADQNWLIDDLFPMFNPAINHEYAYVISVEGLELMTTFRIHNMVKNRDDLNKNLRVEIFFDPIVAKEWLFDTTKLIP